MFDPMSWLRFWKPRLRKGMISTAGPDFRNLCKQSLKKDDNRGQDTDSDGNRH